jgi:hypothetical protein
MAKYRPLEVHLAAHEADAAPMTFAEIEAVLGAKLPAAAHVHRAWWSNNPANNVMTQSWLAAGFRTEQVDIPGQTLVFRRDIERSLGEPVIATPVRSPPPALLLDRLWARLAGTVRTPKLVDLTDPVGDAWDAAS